MTSMVVLSSPTPVRPHRGVGIALLAIVMAVVSVVAFEGIGDDRRSAGTPAVPTAPVDAIGRWVASNGAVVFPGAEGRYVGTCPATSTGPTVRMCSSLREDLGDVQLHSVGVYATDWGADLLLERRDEAGWVVTGVSQWPQLGSRYDGSPWSPVTAITAWWYERAPARYGAGAVHLRSCSDASVVGDATQPLLCSVLIDDRDAMRTYSSGLAGAPPDVELTVIERPDRTWLVTKVVQLRDEA